MFSDSRASGEQKGFRTHGPHFIPWLRNSLKPHHHHGGSDLGLNGQYKAATEGCNSLNPLEKAKGMGFFSIPGRDRAKKAEIRCNGVGMARMLPVVLRGHHILPGGLGKQKEESPAEREKKSPEPNPVEESNADDQTGPGDGPNQGPINRSASEQDKPTFVKNHSGSHLSLLQSQTDGSSSTPVRKYGPLVGLPRAPVPPTRFPGEEPNCEVPVVVVAMEEEDRTRGGKKVWDYASSTTTYRRRDLRSSSWLSSAETQGLAERRQQGFTSSGFSYIKQQHHGSRHSQSHRDLTLVPRELPAEGFFNGPLSGMIFSSDLPPMGPGCTKTLRGPGCTKTLRGPRKPRPDAEQTAIFGQGQGQGQTWVQHTPTDKGEPQRKGAGCSRKVVRNQIKRVVDNLEHVLTALRDVQQEMREVVQQIDFLTSAIDLNEEEMQWSPDEGVEGEGIKPPGYVSCSSGPNFSETHRWRPLDHESQPGIKDTCGTLVKDNRRRSHSPPSVLLCPVSSSERTFQTLRFTCSQGSSPRQGGPPQYDSHHRSSSNPPQLLTSKKDLTLSPPRSLPVRPPTPGLSPLTVNHHHPGSSPDSRPHSPVPSSSVAVCPLSPKKPHPHPHPHPPLPNTTTTLIPSVFVENKDRPHRTTHSNHPSAGQLSPSSSLQAPSGGCRPPADSETQPFSHSDNRETPASSDPGPSHGPSPAATARPPTAQGRRGRKPPPYPHRGASEPAKKAKETRKAPPYPEKRRLLSTTV